MGGGACEVLPLWKGGGGGKSFSHAEGGGHNKCWGNFYAVAWSFSHIKVGMGGGGQQVSTLGAQQVLSYVEVGHKKFQTRDFSILKPPSL